MLPTLFALASLNHCAQTPPLPRESPTAAHPAAEPLTSYAGEPLAPLRVVYEGTWALEAHLAKPHDAMKFDTRLTVLDGGAKGARLDWATWESGHEDKREVETTLIIGDRVLHRAEAAKPFVEVTGKRATILRARVEAAAPWRTLARIRGARERCVAVAPGSFEWRERAEDGGAARTFAWDTTTKRLTSVTRTFAHPRLGDACDDVRYEAWTDRDGVTVPSAFVVHEAEGKNVLKTSPTTFDVRLAQIEAGVDVAHELDLPSDVSAPEVAPADEGSAPFVALELEPGVFSFGSPALDSRTWIVEFADHLLAIDAPLSSAIGEHIVDAVRARFPSKPLRYVLFGHYHPYYTGGLRAFMDAGATVVAPEGCAKFAAEIAERPFTLAPDRWARTARKAKIEAFHGERVFEDATRRLVAIDIGAKSHHTDEYVVFHLPRTRTLLQDDIGWSASKDGKLSFGVRSRGLFEALTERQLDVQTLWQSWPITSTRPSITFPELENGVRAAH